MPTLQEDLNKYQTTTPTNALQDFLGPHMDPGQSNLQGDLVGDNTYNPATINRMGAMDYWGTNKNQRPGFSNQPPRVAGPGGIGNLGMTSGGTPFPGAEGLNMLLPGAAENFFAQNQGRFTAPGQLNPYAAQAAGHVPLTPADMSSYYDNAGRQATEGINKTMAARGSYGSSAAGDMISEALTNLAADRAKNEASYGLNRSADERAWTGQIGGLLGASDQGDLARLLGGGRLAEGAQGAQTTRGQNMFNNNLGLGNALSATMGTDYGNMFSSDADLFGSFLKSMIGQGTEGQAQANAAASTSRADTSDFLNNWANLTKASTGAYDTFNKPAPPVTQPTQPKTDAWV